MTVKTANGNKKVRVAELQPDYNCLVAVDGKNKIHVIPFDKLVFEAEQLSLF